MLKEIKKWFETAGELYCKDANHTNMYDAKTAREKTTFNAVQDEKMVEKMIDKCCFFINDYVESYKNKCQVVAKVDYICLNQEQMTKVAQYFADLGYNVSIDSTYFYFQW